MEKEKAGPPLRPCRAGEDLKVDADGHITSYMADVNTDEAYTGDTEVIKD